MEPKFPWALGSCRWSTAYDALTSDRPYRPKLSTAEAVEIIMQRRGTITDQLPRTLLLVGFWNLSSPRKTWDLSTPPWCRSLNSMPPLSPRLHRSEPLLGRSGLKTSHRWHWASSAKPATSWDVRFIWLARNLRA